MGFGIDKYPASTSTLFDLLNTCIACVPKSSAATDNEDVGEPAWKTARPRATRIPEMSPNVVAIGSSLRFATSRTPNRQEPRSEYVHTIRCSDSNAYVDIPKTHCGAPNSASMGHRGSIA